MKRDTAQEMRVRVHIKAAHTLSLRDPQRPQLPERKVKGPQTVWGSLQLIRNLAWFIPDDYGGYGILQATPQKSLIKAWDDDEIEAYSVDPTTGTERELFNDD